MTWIVGNLGTPNTYLISIKQKLYKYSSFYNVVLVSGKQQNSSVYTTCQYIYSSYTFPSIIDYYKILSIVHFATW